MFLISKEFHFSASHQLDWLPDDHQCARLHGHNYVVIVRLAGRSLDDDWFVLDYGDLAPFKRLLDEEWDHRHINDFIENPTAEVMAVVLHKEATRVLALPEGVRVFEVEVRETPKTSAIYRPGNWAEWAS